jgi:hypothetical protein
VADLVVMPVRPSPHDLDAIGASIDIAQAAGVPFGKRGKQLAADDVLMVARPPGSLDPRPRVEVMCGMQAGYCRLRRLHSSPGSLIAR